MRADDNASGRAAVTGTALGALGVAAFSLSLPATRAAVADLSPWLVAFGRAVGAGLLAAGYLALRRAPRPTPAQLRRSVVVALGVVVGFPLLTSLAMVTQGAAHGAVVIALLPAVTAVFAVLRVHERPSRTFWLAAAAGVLAILLFTLVTNGMSGLTPADGFLLGAVLLCGLGYAEGGALARELGGAETICWALVVSLPVTVPVTALALAAGGPVHAGPTAWLGFGYVTAVSMFLGFFAWYAGLARGGVARVGQIQLAQPLLTLAWAAVLLGERVTPAAVGAAAAVLVCVAVTQRTRSGPPRAEAPVLSSAGRRSP